jgi:nitric oxide reductase subunit C
VGVRKDRAWLDRFLVDPQAVKPGVLMPKPDVTDSERQELVDYLLSLKQ